MRQKILLSIAGFVFTVVIPTVVTMMWDKIDRASGWSIIIISAIIGLVALVVAFIPTAKKLPPVRNKPFRAAMRYVAAGRWPADDGNSIGGKIEVLKALAAQLWQAAIDGEITIWGRKHSARVHEPLTREYLVENPYNSFVHTGLDPSRIINQLMNYPVKDDYVDLMVNKAEIETKWPPRK